ncbi:MAG TPA: DNA translocase FtsK 4TM domain-containing protein, partial [Micropepsaceae bacterium]|nr:DNA translocase FtsK 4TM domain-containing protein [Micropepsaceae bacterium]
MGANRSIGVYQPRSRRGQIADAFTAFRDWLRTLITETLWRGFGLGLLLIATAMLVSLLSYDPADPSLDVATGRDVANWLGGLGAYSADLLFQLFGTAAFALALTIGCWGWAMARGARLKQLALRLAAALLGALLLAAALGAAPELATLPAGDGGIPGRMTLVFTARIASAFAPWLALAVPILFASLGLVLVFVATGLKARILVNAPLGAFALLQSAGMSLFRLAFRRRDPEEIEDSADEAWDEDEADDDAFDPDEELADANEDDDEPPLRDMRGRRVQREERPRKLKGKADSQPALNLAEGEYQLPPLGLLTEPPAETIAPAVNDDALEENARLLEAVLGDFGVRGRIVAVRPGPVVTLYELEP